MNRRMVYINARFLTQKTTGVQRFAMELSKCLKHSEISMKWVAPKNILHKELAEVLNVELIGANKGHLWEQVDLPRYLKAHGTPLLVNLCNTAPLFYRNSITTIHDLAFLENPQWFSKKFYWYYRFLIPKIAHVSKQILTVSEFSKNEICNKLSIQESRVSVIYNAVSKRFTTRDSYNIGDYILFVGSLDPRKNLQGLIKAMAYTPKEIKLKVVGCGGKSFSGASQEKWHEKIDILGYVSDEKLIELYTNSRGFIYPSFYEGFGIPPLEAQAIGVPVLVSNIPVFKEVFSDSVNYCNIGNSEEVAQSIIELYNMSDDERVDLIEKGYLNVNRYSWSNSTEELMKVLLKHAGVN